MDKAAWVDRCTARFIERARMPLSDARAYAEAVLENLDNDLSEDPELAADEDISCWAD